MAYLVPIDLINGAKHPKDWSLCEQGPQKSDMVENHARMLEAEAQGTHMNTQFFGR